MKKEKYYNPYVEVIELPNDIISTSGPFDPFDPNDEGTDAWDD